MIVNHLTTSSQLNHHFPNNQCTIWGRWSKI
jgi:hypothetical protein